MDLVVDANILFAAFIKNSTTRTILLTKTPLPVRLYTTPFILDEIYKYRKLLAIKVGITEKEVVELVQDLISASNIEIIKKEELDIFKEKSETISPSKNDAPYFAAALYKNCKIWSNDKPIKKQIEVDVISTKELLDLINEGNLF